MSWIADPLLLSLAKKAEESDMVVTINIDIIIHIMLHIIIEAGHTAEIGVLHVQIDIKLIRYL